MFCHITSHVQGVKYDDLLGKVGGRGFPHLVWLDAEGKVLAKQGARSVDGFAAMGKNVDAYLELKKKLDGGDKSVENDLFLAELGLGTVKYPDAKTRLAKLQLTEAQQGTAGTLMLNLEVDWRQSQMPRGRRGMSQEQIAQLRAKAAALVADAQVSYLAHHQAGRFPTNKISAYYFTNVLVQKALKDKNVALFEGVYAKLKKLAQGDAMFSRVWPHMDDQLAKLKAAAAEHEEEDEGNGNEGDDDDGMGG